MIPPKTTQRLISLLTLTAATSLVTTTLSAAPGLPSDNAGAVIEGAGNPGYTISGTVSAANATLNNFRTVGASGTAGADGKGGAIHVTATGALTLTNYKFTGNAAAGGAGSAGAGGNGLGGAIYVENGGSLTLAGNTLFQFNNAQGGSGSSSYPGGQAVGTDLFMEKGASVTIAPGAGNTAVFNGTIADNSQASLAGAPNGVGQGASLTVASGTVVFNGVNTYTGATVITGGVLRATDGAGINTNSNITFAGTPLSGGGVLETSGVFTRYTGTAGDRVQWTGDGGFAARGGVLVVSLNNGASRTWGQDGFVASGSALVFGSASSTDNVTFVNAVNLDGGSRTVLVNANTAGNNRAIITGVLSNGALTVGDATHGGVLELAAANTYAGGTTVNGGVLTLGAGGSLAANGALVVNAGFDVSRGGDRTVGSLSGNASGVISLGANRLILNQSADGAFAGSLTDGTLAAAVAAGVSPGGTGGALTKSGVGTLTLTGANTFTGSAVVSQGALTLSGAGSLATATVSVSAGATLNNASSGLASDATLTVDGTANFLAADTIATLNGANTGTVNLNGGALTVSSGTFAGNVSGTSALNKTGSGTLTLSGLNAHTGALAVNGGELVLSGNIASATVDIASGAKLTSSAGGLVATAVVTNAGAFDIGAVGDTVATYTGTGTLNGSGTLSANTYTLQNGAVINANLGAGALTSDGAVRLNGSSNAATVAVNTGTLTLGAAERLRDTAVVSVASGAKLATGGAERILTLDGAGEVDVTGGTLTVSDGAFTGVISGTHATNGLVKRSLGTLTLGGANTYVGDTRVQDGVLVLASGASLASRSVVVDANKTLDSRFGGLASDAAVTLAGIYEMGATDETVGTFAATGTLNGAATLTAATYALGEDAVINANLGAGALSALSTATPNGATLNGTSLAATVSVATGGKLTLGSADRLDNAVALTVDGRLVLGGDETVASLAGSGVVTLDRAGHLGALTLSSGDFSGVIEGADPAANNLVKNGADTLTLTGANTYLGTTYLNAGTIVLSGAGAIESRAIEIAAGATLDDRSSGLSSLAAIDNAGTLALGADDTVDTLVNSGAITGTGRKLTARTYALNDGSVVRANLGSGVLTTNGVVALDGASAAETVRVASGETTLGAAERLLDTSVVTVDSGARLVLGGNEKITTLLGAGEVDVAAGALTVSDGTFDGVVTGATATGGLVKVSAGTLTLTGANTYLGDTTVSRGTLVLDGSLASLNVSVAAGQELRVTTGTIAFGPTYVHTVGGLSSDTSLTVNGRATFSALGVIAGLNGTGTVDLTGATLAVASGTWSGDLTGTNATFVQYRPGTLTVSGANTASGSLYVEGGTLLLTGSFLNMTSVEIATNSTLRSTASGLSTSAAIDNTGTLDIAAADQTVASYEGAGLVTGTATLTAATYRLDDGSTIAANLGAGALETHGAVSITGTVGASSVRIDGTTTLGSESRFTATPSLEVTGLLVLGGSEAVGDLTGSGEIATVSGSVFSAESGLFSGTLSGAGAFGKTGMGALALGGTLSFTGAVRVSGGVLELDTALVSTDVTVAAGASLDATDGQLASGTGLKLGGAATIGSPTTLASLDGAATGSLVFAAGAPVTVAAGDYAGAISGDGSLEKTGTGVLTLSGAQSFVGETRVSDGTLVLSGSSASTSVIVAPLATLRAHNGGLAVNAAVDVAGALDIGAASQHVGSLALTGTLAGTGKLTAATYTLGDGAQVNADLGAGALEVTGAATLVGASDAAVVNIASGGHLTLLSANRLADNAAVTVDGRLDLVGGDDTIGSLWGSGIVDGSTAKHVLIVLDGGDFSGRFINRVEGLNVGGDLTLRGATAVENVSVNGNLVVSGPSATLSAPTIGIASGSSITVDSSSQLTYTRLTNDGALNYNGVFVNNGIVYGHGTFNGDFSNATGGSFRPGNSPGVATIAGNYAEGGVLEIELAGNGGVPGADFDQVRVGGTVTFAPTGTLVVQGFGGFVPQRGGSFQAISDASGAPVAISGALGSVLFDLDGAAGPGAPVGNAAAVIDLATGRVLTSGLNSPTSAFADLATTGNERKAVAAVFSSAQLAPGQIDSTTAAGTTAVALLAAAPDMSRLTPEAYSGLLDYGIGASRIAESVTSKVNPFNPLPGTKAGEGAFFGGARTSEAGLATSGTRYTRNDFVGGAEISLGDKAAVGVFGAGSTGSVRNPSQKSDAEGFAAGVYAKGAISDRFSLAGAFTYSGDSFDTKRRTLTGNVTSDTDVDSFSGLVSLGYDAYRSESFLVTPRAGFAAAYATAGRTAETGAADALDLDGYDKTRVSARAGLAAVWSAKVFGLPVSFELTGDVDYAFVNDAQDLRAAFANDASVRYAFTAAKDDDVSFLYGANVGFGLTESATLHLGYSGRAGYADSNDFTAAVRIRF